MSSGLQPRLAGRAHWLVSRSPAQELALTLLLGAIGAGIIFGATRQSWAQVHTILPRPLPASRVLLTGAALVPYADALVIAGLATLAAILASRRLLRRLAGLLLALIGAGLAASAFTLSKATALSAAAGAVSPETAPAGSVTGGSGTAGSTPPDVSGTATHVAFAAAGWQLLVVVGALAMVAAGLIVIWRSAHMPVMSSRYDSPTAPARRAAGTAPEQAAPARKGSAQASDSASIWEALSRGDDPTSAAGSRSAGA